MTINFELLKNCEIIGVTFVTDILHSTIVHCGEFSKVTNGR